MSSLQEKLISLQGKKDLSPVRVYTLGSFKVYRQGEEIKAKEWGRDKTIQLFQYLVTLRYKKGLHKEQLIDGLWEDAGMKDGDRDFKVALHGIHKALEPERESRSEAKYVLRQGLTYFIDESTVWIDAEIMERFIELGNEALGSEPEVAMNAYKSAIELHQGIYLPNRLYEDWSSEERERLQVLILGSYITLAELKLNDNPLESIRLAQQALLIDSGWEDAYRIQMQAYLIKGNRPQAIKVYRQCEKVLDEDFGLDPLPETKALLKKIEEIS